MSKLICVMGESGSGKTTAMRTLDPKTTYYIDCDGKGLAWKGWRSQYNEENKNFAFTRDIPKIEGLIVNISQKKASTKTIVVDTLNTCMVDKEVKGMKENGFGKWIDLTQFVWNCIETAGRQRDDLTIIFVMHSETVRDDFGYSFTRVKTNGRKLEKLVPESLFGTVLLAKKTDDDRYVFETQAKNSTAKSPMGAFETFEIENDMGAVLKALEDTTSHQPAEFRTNNSHFASVKIAVKVYLNVFFAYIFQHILGSRLFNQTLPANSGIQLIVKMGASAYPTGNCLFISAFTNRTPCHMLTVHFCPSGFFPILEDVSALKAFIHQDSPKQMKFHLASVLQFQTKCNLH